MAGTVSSSAVADTQQQIATVVRRTETAPLSPVRPVPVISRAAVVFDHVSFAFDDQVVLQDVSFVVPEGSMIILVGASGAGKSVVLKLILGLLRPDAGRIFVKGRRIDNLTEQELIRVRAGIGMLFQGNALFDSLTVAENVGYRLSEEVKMPPIRCASV